MREFKGLKAEFKIAATSPDHFPKAHFPHIVFCGRSNVGKSSLINHLLSKNGLAHTSSTPGRTQTINFFLIDDAYYVVDLPGYGFASRSHKQRNDWSKLIEAYFEEIPSCAIVLHLVDGRHPPFESDLQFYEWCETLEKKPLVIFTKIDKIKGKDEIDALSKSANLLGKDIEYSTYSIRDTKHRISLLKKINQVISNG